MQYKKSNLLLYMILLWLFLLPNLASAQNASTYFHKGKQMNFKKDYSNALAAFNQALALDPNHVKALYERGVLRLYYLYEPELALADLELVYQKDPSVSKTIFYDLANAQSSLGLKEIAIENFNKSLERLPRFICAANNRGICQSDLGKYEEALQDFELALKKDSKEHKKHIYINRADVFAALGEWDNAKKDFENSLAIDPYNPYVFKNRAYWEMKRQEFGAAMNDLTIALNLQVTLKDKTKPDLFNNRGFLYFLSGNYQKAIEDDDSLQSCKKKDYQILYDYRKFAESALNKKQADPFSCFVWDEFVGNTNYLFQATINRKTKITHQLGGIFYCKDLPANIDPSILVDGKPFSCKWKKMALNQLEGFTTIALQSDLYPLKGKHSYQLALGLSVSQLVFINQEKN